jgi:hypothetical protein
VCGTALAGGAFPCLAADDLERLALRLDVGGRLAQAARHRAPTSAGIVSHSRSFEIRGRERPLSEAAVRQAAPETRPCQEQIENAKAARTDPIGACEKEWSSGDAGAR